MLHFITVRANSKFGKLTHGRVVPADASLRQLPISNSGRLRTVPGRAPVWRWRRRAGRRLGSLQASSLTWSALICLIRPWAYLNMSKLFSPFPGADTASPDREDTRHPAAATETDQILR